MRFPRLFQNCLFFKIIEIREKLKPEKNLGGDFAQIGNGQHKETQRKSPKLEVQAMWLTIEAIIYRLVRLGELSYVCKVRFAK